MPVSVTGEDHPPMTLATFRTATDADRLLATAVQHPRGWRLTMPDSVGSIETATFEGCVSALLARTGPGQLTITWMAGGQS